MKKGERPQFPNFKVTQEYINEMLEFILQGYNYSDIHEYFSLTHNLTDDQIKHIHAVAKEEVFKNGDFDLEMVVMQHIQYYEECIRYFDSVNNFGAKASAMNAKEKLLKIFEEKEPDIEIENNINISVEQLDYNVEKLSIAEKNEFQMLFNKVKRIN